MVYEIYRQLQEKAGPRQLGDPRMVLAPNLGGISGMGIAGCVVLGDEK